MVTVNKALGYTFSMSLFPTVALIGKKHDARAAQTLRDLTLYLLDLEGKGVLKSVLVHSDNAPEISGPDAEFADWAQIRRRSNLVIVVGGDGTLLGVGRELAGSGVPLLGIHQGRLGFMVDVNPGEMRETLAQVLKGEYSTEDRLLLSARVLHEDGKISGPFLAVNDVVIRNQAAIRMLEFETWMDGEFISQHRADGFIVSSPTGSTAYALSGGGPVLHPGLDAFALVPICPHTLSDRPIVIGGDRTVKIVLRGAAPTLAMFTCDSQTNETLHPGDAIEVSRAPHKLKLIHPKSYSYFDILRNKLHWGRVPAQLRDE